MTKPITEPQLIRIRRQGNRACELDSELFDWMPDSVRRPAKRITVDYTPSSSAVAAFGSAELQSPAEFLRTLPVTQGKGKGGYCDPDRYPYQPHLLEILRHPCWQTAVIAAGNQSAKSTVGEAYVADCAKNNPRDVGIFYPAAKPVQKKFRESLIPIFKNKNFRYLQTGVDDDLNINLIKLSLMSITAGNTSSLLDMSSFSFGLVIIEEADKVQEEVSRNETSIKYLLKGRLNDYGPDGRTIWISTLSVDGAPCSRELHEVEVRLDFLPRCPYCGGEHQLDDKHLDYVIDNRMFAGERQVHSVRYVCPLCKAKWTEADRRTALLAGRFAARERGWKDKLDKEGKYVHDPRWIIQLLYEDWPRSIGTAIPALAVPTVSMLFIAEIKEKAKTDIAAAKYHANHHRAETFSLSGHRRQPEAILKRSWGWPRLVVPPASDDLAYILAGCDTQHDSLYYVIMAFGWPYTRDGHHCRPKAWVIDQGNIPTVAVDQQTGAKRRLPVELALQQIEALRFMDSLGCRERAPGIPYAVDSIFIDSRGDNRDRAGNRHDELRHWAAQTVGTTRRILCWGEKSLDFGGKLYRAGKIDDPLRPGSYLLRLDVDRNATEDEVESMLMVAPDDNGALLVNADCNITFAEHLCASQQNTRTGRWEPVPGKRRDLRDCVRLAIAGRSMLWDQFAERAAAAGDPRRVLAPWMR